MAKKAVGKAKKAGVKKSMTKLIVSIRSEKTGAYTFKEEIIPAEKLKETLSRHK